MKIGLVKGIIFLTTITDGPTINDGRNHHVLLCSMKIVSRIVSKVSNKYLHLSRTLIITNPNNAFFPLDPNPNNLMIAVHGYFFCPDHELFAISNSILMVIVTTTMRMVERVIIKK